MPIAWTLDRTMTAERMDSADLDRSEHRRALAGLRRINRVSRTAAVMLGPIAAFLRRRNLRRPIRLLDVACGGGDVPVEIAAALTRDGAIVELTLFDRSPVALEQARQTARNAGLVATTASGDAPDALPGGPWDVVTCGLFLHHLDRAGAVAVLRRLRTVTEGIVVVSDLRRSMAGLIAAHAGCRILSRSGVVHHDGPASVRAAWTIDEMRRMARDAGMEGALVRRQWPWRMLLEWEPNQSPPV